MLVHSTPQILLGYLPLETKEWETVLKQQRYVGPSYPCGFAWCQSENNIGNLPFLLSLSPLSSPPFSLCLCLLLSSSPSTPPFPSSPLSLLLLLPLSSSSSSPPHAYMYRDLYQHLMNEVVLNTHTDSEKSETIDHVSRGREQQDMLCISWCYCNISAYLSLSHPPLLGMETEPTLQILACD